METQEPGAPTAQARAERLAEERGFDLREATLVEKPGGTGPRHELRLRGVPVWGLEAKTAHGQTHFTHVRLEPGVRVETEPRLSQAQAELAALEALKQPSAVVTGARLVLVPREERRRKADAPASARPNAAHYERVVTGFTLLYQVELSAREADTGSELPWMVRVEALSGAVLEAKPLVDPAKEYRTAVGYGYFSGTRNFLTLYDTEYESYEFEDLHGNTYTTSQGAFENDDEEFGDGRLFIPRSHPVSENGETAAVDAHYAVNMAWTFFEVVLGMNGPNGNGRPVKVRVHERMTNAYYLPHATRPELLVGYAALVSIPQLKVLTPLTTTDIIGHELGHDFFRTALVPEAPTTDLGRTELAGMNEGTADIIGFLTELTRDVVRAGRSPLYIDMLRPRLANFTSGEEVGPAYRNYLQPEHPEWYDGIGELDPHYSAGPISRMFLLLAYGCEPRSAPRPGSGMERYCPLIRQGFAGIGPIQAARIWKSTVEALPMGADFLQARELALQAARSEDVLHGTQTRRAVAFAFAAVGVGDLPDDMPPKLSLSCQQEGLDLKCSGIITDPDAVPGEYRQPSQLSVSGTSLTWSPPDGPFTHTFPGASLAPGNHVVELRAWDSWNNQALKTITVLLDKAGPQASVARSGPPKEAILTVTATDPSGISRIEFLDGTQLLKTVTALPYVEVFDTSSWTDGTHDMVIKVYDTFNNVSVLHHGLLVDNTRPVVTATVGSSGPPFTVNASATDVSALVRADFKVDGLLFATRNTGSPYQATYTPTDPLAHNLTVEVTDAFGNKGVATVTAPLDRTPPTVTFSAQQGPTGDITLQVGASDTCGLLYPYGLYVDGALVAEVTTPGYVLVLASSAVSAGVHAFHALVRDNCGNTTQFQTTFTKVHTPPVIAAIVRDDTQPKKPKFTVQCNDLEGVHHVEMRENGVIRQSDSVAPYEFVVDTTTRTDGSYSVLFQCTDIYGASSSPQTHTVTADNTGPVIQSFTVYGGGTSYQVTAGSVTDPRGVKNVRLQGGLVGPSFNVTLTQPPWFHNFFFSPIVIKSQFPFWVTARDAWDNETSHAYSCYMDTTVTQNRYLTCSRL